MIALKFEQKSTTVDSCALVYLETSLDMIVSPPTRDESLCILFGYFTETNTIAEPGSFAWTKGRPVANVSLRSTTAVAGLASVK